MQKKKKQWGYLLPIIIFVAMAGILFRGSALTSEATEQRERESLEDAVVQSAVHCYSVEGEYPESLDYLKEHYGLTWNEKKYKVSYEVIAKNLRPEVKVIVLSGQ